RNRTAAARNRPRRSRARSAAARTASRRRAANRTTSCRRTRTPADTGRTKRPRRRSYARSKADERQCPRSRPAGRRGRRRTAAARVCRRRSSCCYAKHHQPCGGVRYRNVVVAVDLRHRLSESAAHHEPRDELYALRAREPDEVMNRESREILGLVDDLLEAVQVEFLVDETCAFAVE